MKKLILLCLLFTGLRARAANPTFSSFNPLQFSSNSFQLSLNVPLPSAGTTNVLLITPSGQLTSGQLLNATALQANKPVYTDGSLRLVSSPTAGNGPVKYLKFNFPRYVDGAGCTIPNTNNFTANDFMVPLFSSTAVSNVNYCRFAVRVPPDLDTNADLTASVTMSMAASNSGDQQYNIGMSSTAHDGALLAVGNYVPFLLNGIVVGSSGNIVSKDNITLTGWKSVAVPGQYWLIELARAGSDPHDASTAATYFRELEISYHAVQ